MLTCLLIIRKALILVVPWRISLLKNYGKKESGGGVGWVAISCEEQIFSLVFCVSSRYVTDWGIYSRIIETETFKLLSKIVLSS